MKMRIAIVFQTAPHRGFGEKLLESRPRWCFFLRKKPSKFRPPSQIVDLQPIQYEYILLLLVEEGIGRTKGEGWPFVSGFRGTDLSHPLDKGRHHGDPSEAVEADSASAEERRRHLRLDLVHARSRGYQA